MNKKRLVPLIVMGIFSLISLPSWAQSQQQKENKLNFTSFSVSTGEKRISIAWSIENSIPTNYFEIQKSIDGVNFKTIALVLGPDPRHTSGDSYGYFDKDIRKNAKHFYYRLRHIDIDGAEQLSEVKLLAKL